MRKKFSIITPVYNEEDKIRKSIKSVIEQDNNLYEYIIVDGGSKDLTVNILNKNKKLYPDNIRYISEPDRGLYDAMNKGINMSQGDYLFFLGAGDILRPNILEKVSMNLNNQKEIIYGQMFNVAKGYNYNGIYDKIKLSFVPMPHQAMFYHKTIFDSVGMYNQDYKILADYEFNLRCYQDDTIEKDYIDLVISDFEGNGISTREVDKKLKREKKKLVRKYLGEKCYELYMVYNPSDSDMSNFWIDKFFIDFIQNNSSISFAIFGAGSFGIGLYNFIKNYNDQFGTNVIVNNFFDNNESKWGTSILNKKILKPEMGNINKLDKIIVASLPGREEIRKQLINMGVIEENIFIL